MMKVTREQAAEIINFDMVAAHSAPYHIDPPRYSAKDVSRIANGAWGEISLLPTGAKLYRYKDRNNMPAYCIVGYASDGSDVSKLAALLPLT